MGNFIKEHKHDFSLYLNCLNCFHWGKSKPDSHYDCLPCSECGSLETVAYYPKCCLFNVKEIHAHKWEEPLKEMAKSGEIF
jgi:hypothetical protein